MTVVFLLWIIFDLDGTHVTLEVDDIGQLVAAWCATVVCGAAAFRVSVGRVTWALFAVSSFAWGAGELVWCYYALIKNIPVPFPSLADVGFLTAVPLAFTGLLLYPPVSVGLLLACKESSTVASSPRRSSLPVGQLSSARSTGLIRAVS